MTSAPRIRTLGPALAAMLLATALLATACATGAPPTAPPTSAAPESDPAAFCGAAVDAARALDAGPDLGPEPLTPEQTAAAFAEYRARLEPPLAVIERDPPPMLRDAVDTLARQARYAIDNQDAAALATPEFESAADRLLTYVSRDCGYPVVRVVATDYAYQGIPPTLGQGTTVFSEVNRGAEPHELNIYRIDDDVTQPMAEIVRLPEPQRAEVLDDVGSASAGPGSSTTVFVALSPGRYGVACFELRGTTPEKVGTGPPHADLGMIAEFTVQ